MIKCGGLWVKTHIVRPLLPKAMFYQEKKVTIVLGGAFSNVRENSSGKLIQTV
jgi:hypothetical protein